MLNTNQNKKFSPVQKYTPTFQKDINKFADIIENSNEMYSRWIKKREGIWKGSIVFKKTLPNLKENKSSEETSFCSVS